MPDWTTAPQPSSPPPEAAVPPRWRSASPQMTPTGAGASCASAPSPAPRAAWPPRVRARASTRTKPTTLDSSNARPPFWLQPEAADPPR
eukprot:941529-Rhodomonas_salina.1